MKLHWTDWTVITVIAGAGCLAIYAALELLTRRALRERQRDMEWQLKDMATTVKNLQARVAELSKAQSAAGEAAKTAAAETAGEPKQPQTKPEIVAALTAAATAFLGKKTRVQSAQLLPGAQQEGAGAWAQQGRMIVQTSHNPRQRG